MKTLQGRWLQIRSYLRFLSLIMPLVIFTSSTLVYSKIEKKWRSENYLSKVPATAELVCDRIWVARNFGLANMILIEFETSYVIIDAMESFEAAQDALAALVVVSNMESTSKPISKVIVTHFHQDHTYGLGAISDYNQKHGFPAPQIWSHYLTLKFLKNALAVTAPIMAKRGFRQFGGAEDPKIDSCGIGPALRIGHGEKPVPLLPTHVFGVEKDEEYLFPDSPTNSEGELMKLLYTPGESDDQITAYLPNRCGGGVIFPGDNVYKGAFPSIMPIRGAPFRDPLKWVASLNLIGGLHAEFMVPSHNAPYSGKENVEKAINIRMEAISFIRNETIRLMNLGIPKDDIVTVVKLPEHLANDPDLKETYGTVANAVSAVFDGLLSWFSGDAADLIPLSSLEKAQLFLEVGGGAHKLLDKAKKLSSGSITTRVKQLKLLEAIRIGGADQLSTKDLALARTMEAQCLRDLAETQVSRQMANTYLTYARELEGLVILSTVAEVQAHLEGASVSDLLDKMVVSLKPQLTENISKSILFHFTDQSEWIHLRIHRGVAFADHYDKQEDILAIESSSTVVVEMTSDAFKTMAKSSWDSPFRKTLSFMYSWITRGIVFKKGTAREFKTILGYFETNPVKEESEEDSEDSLLTLPLVIPG